MPFIDRDRWNALAPLLDEALSLTEEERESWLGELRSRSPEVAAEVASLLADKAAADRDGFLATPVVASAAGLRIGAYILEHLLGQGGMGSVWLARRVDGRFEGQAAVKLLNLALLSAAGQERFRREGSVLARLAHPGIARLSDAGVSPAGQPYLVLEHVEGECIDAFADERRLTAVERIGLVLQVLSAVAHAHANLIVHRDLKPSNILVTADGTAKLLDFGIAKLLVPEGGEEPAALTRDGRALTPEFAAPEQVLGGPITTATDVYAVGVLLYRLLTGRHPYDLAGRSAGEVEHVICESEPPRPSATFAPGDSDVAARAHARGGTPSRLLRHLSGDLDVIVMKALRKEPERRYPTAAALQDDLRRFLDGLPVRARPDTTAYRVRKFVARHRTGVALGAGLVLLLAGAALRERSLRGRAEAEARKAKAVEDYLVSVFDVADPYAPPDKRGGDVTARALLDRGALRVDSSLTGQPEVQAELRGVLGRVYTSLGLYDKAAPLLQRSLDQRRLLYGSRHAAVAEAMDRLGEVLANQSRFDEAEPLLREALAQRRALLGNVNADTASSIDHLATLLQERNQFEAAEPLFREAVEVRRAVYGPDHSEVATSLNNLGLLLLLRGHYDETEPLYRQALEIRVRNLGEDHPLTTELVHNLAQLLQQSGRFEEAAVLYRRALAGKRKTLGNLHPSVTVNLNNLGGMLARDLGQLEEAEALIREALALDRQMFGEQHDYTAESLFNLATVLLLKGDFDESERLSRQALAVNRALFGAEHTRVANNLSGIGRARYLQGDIEGAISLFRESLAQYGRLVGEKHRSYASVANNLGRALLEHGDSAEAETLYRATVGQLDNSPNLRLRALFISAQIGLGRTLVAQDRAVEALPVAERALAMSREQFRADDVRTAEARLTLGSALASSRQPEKAESLLREALDALKAHRRAQPQLARDAERALGEVLRALGRPETKRFATAEIP